MFRDNLVRLRHMADAAREAIAFAEHRRREDLDHDRMLALSLVKCIEIVGEAAAQVTCCLLYTSPSPRDRTRSRMPSSA